MVRRDRELALDYPLIISKITLFLGAGMSIRNIFMRLGEDYREKRRKGVRNDMYMKKLYWSAGSWKAAYRRHPPMPLSAEGATQGSMPSLAHCWLRAR